MWSPTREFRSDVSNRKGFVCELPEYEYEITIGSISEHELTKTVLCVAAEKGQGESFHDTRYSRIITNIRQKLIHEPPKPGLHLDLPKGLRKTCGLQYYRYTLMLGIKVRPQYISEIVGWVKACGFDCKVKPDSYCASSIADRVSK